MHVLKGPCAPLLLSGAIAFAGITAAPVTLASDLIEQGRHLFFTETFAGNGRTCGTCHPADNNYTIDPVYIARLPKNDPLFVAEQDPNLRQLERPRLLRQLGLIVVHADGFGKPGVLRGVPTLLGIKRALAVEPGSLILPGRTHDLAAATGWSGDGAPGDGSLRQFARGAVEQHLTRSLDREPGVDFRYPTAAELDALEAFMLSLGRPDELDLADFTGVTFRSQLVESGRQLFNSERSGSCRFCHNNATALNEGGFNGMFDIGTTQRLDTPARRLSPNIPGDGGFGPYPKLQIGRLNFFGNGRMNTPSLIEAADTPPFFHDNSAATVEAAVRFYTSSDFANSLDGQTQPAVDLKPGEVVAIAALLRTLNAIENIRSSNELLQRALGKRTTSARALVRLASADTEDAIAVLTGGPRQLYASATTLVRMALQQERHAAREPSLQVRDLALRRAIELKELARGQMVNQP